jgi:hypothetical protein
MNFRSHRLARKVFTTVIGVAAALMCLSSLLSAVFFHASAEMSMVSDPAQGVVIVFLLAEIALFGCIALGIWVVRDGMCLRGVKATTRATSLATLAVGVWGLAVLLASGKTNIAWVDCLGLSISLALCWWALTLRETESQPSSPD